MKKLSDKFKKYSLRLTVIIICGYLMILFLMFFTQERLLFHPVKTPKDYKFQLNSEFEEHWTNVNGKLINSLYLKQKDPKGVLIYFHGNACNLMQCAPTVDELSKKTGWDVWIVDYPGYGKSEGAITSENQLHELANEMFKEVEKLNPKKIIIFGRSLGTGLATQLASRNKVAGLILETPYLSIKNLALKEYPFIPSVFLKYHLRSDLWIKNVKSKILMLHGTDDTLIPLSNAEALAKLSSNSTLIIIPGGQHDNLSSFPDYWDALKTYLKN